MVLLGDFTPEQINSIMSVRRKTNFGVNCKIGDTKTDLKKFKDAVKKLSVDMARVQNAEKQKTSGHFAGYFARVRFF